MVRLRRSAEDSSRGHLNFICAIALGILVGATTAMWFPSYSPKATVTYYEPSETTRQLECPPQVIQEPSSCPTCPSCPTCSTCATCQTCPICPQPAAESAPLALASSGEVNHELKAILEKVAINNEVMIAVSNHALITPDGKYGILATFVESVKEAGVKNFVLVAMDRHTEDAMKAIGVAVWRTSPQELADKNQDNHGVSSQKFGIINEFLKLGYHVLLSDVDIVTLKNPFNYLYRDSDVEGLSDGFDRNTAYGWNDGVDDATMGWSRYAQTMRIFVFNSGLFYIRANERTLMFMDLIQARLKARKDWDQSVYNEVMFFPSHGDKKNPEVTKRVMDIHTFMNSKTLFKYTRHNQFEMERLDPVMIHCNYHPDKWERMKAIIQYWKHGKKDALDAFPDGSCWKPPC